MSPVPFRVPEFIAAPNDRTTEFIEALTGIVEAHRGCDFAIEPFISSIPTGSARE